ncbi:hypothetical protein [Brevibacterium sp. XM4083]|uniref:hypothetical protein n=1 Tax=Brevibacterium sp. XM4083 TaxID=2583238 RepID=UPI00112EF565|nr:hypothetical protein [Brevibacterium sp. XM4083]MCM1011915.1 hypothetical protein [Brevibacterium sp. XM4083]
MRQLNVTRAAPTVEQTITRSFGPNLGDSYDTTVTRTGNSVRIYQTGASKLDWSMNLAEARALRDVLSNIVDWFDN